MENLVKMDDLGVPLYHYFRKHPYPLQKSLTSYRSVGEILVFLPPSNFPHIGEQKKTHLEISRLCGLTGNERPRCQYVEGGIIVLGKKKRVDISHHKIGLKIWQISICGQTLKKGKLFFEDSFFFGFFLAIFYSCYFKLASNNYHDSAAILEKTCQPLFLSPNFFSTTLPETNIAPENRPLEKKIPIGNHHSQGLL